MNVLKCALWTQIAWVIAGIGYNLASWWSIEQGGPSFSSTVPAAGIVSLSLFFPIIFLGFWGLYRWYLSLNLVFLSAIFYGGIYIHLVTYFSDAGLDSYSSALAWFFAITINVVGVSAGLIGSWQAWKLVCECE